MFQPLREKKTNNFKYNNATNTIILIRLFWVKMAEKNDQTIITQKENVLTHRARSPGVDTGTEDIHMLGIAESSGSDDSHLPFSLQLWFYFQYVLASCSFSCHIIG